MSNLDDEFLSAMVADEKERGVLLSQWIVAQEPDNSLDHQTVSALVAWCLSMRQRVLRDLVQRFRTLRERDSTRNQDIHKAALCFTEEFERLVERCNE